jgi:class 3 adenylate cyclase
VSTAQSASANLRTVKAVILFADLLGSTSFGTRAGPNVYDQMIRDFQALAREVILQHMVDARLPKRAWRFWAGGAGDECHVFLLGGNVEENAQHALALAVKLRAHWRASGFVTDMLSRAQVLFESRVDLRVGIGCGDVVLNTCPWSRKRTPEGYAISEAKRIEGLAELPEVSPAEQTLIMVKIDISEACKKACDGVAFGKLRKLTGKGITHDVWVAPVTKYEPWADLNQDVVPYPSSPWELLSKTFASELSGAMPADLVGPCEDLVQRHPEFPAGYARYAVILHQLGRRDEAEAAYLRALSLKEDEATVHHDFAILLGHKNRWKDAQHHYLRALELEPDQADIHADYANCLDNLDRHEEANEEYARALQSDPNNAQINYDYGEFLQRIGDEQAQIYIDKAKDLQPGIVTE